MLLSQGGSSVNPADFIPRFSSHLLLNNTDMRVRKLSSRVLPPDLQTRPAFTPGRWWSALKRLREELYGACV